METIEAALLSNCWIVPNGCWLWLGKTDNFGYGCLRATIEGVAGHAHRLAFECWNGSIPIDLHVCHHCDTPACFRPDHLFAGTAKDNMHDMIKKGRWVSRAAGPTCYKGHDNWYTAPGTGKRYCRACYNTNKRGKSKQ